MPFWKKKKEELQPPPPKPAPLPPLEKVELAPPPEKPKFAPLFVKIERYKEVLKNIEKIKLLLDDLRQLINLRAQISRIGQDSHALLEKNIGEISRVISSLDREFVRPRGEKIEPKTEERMEGYISQLRDELARLQSEVKAVE